ncbi:MAG: protein tyrosine phosphatase [Candidatus Pacebacteria bacterium CG10_big_fil_rev_8_21_14_0_10_40_26]|nr:MAG: protein tyrosine phosphatase [Candidatus Pacebacteria bacterium CG10_big_fil_rev_8_21_14_0_10_40_26]
MRKVFIVDCIETVMNILFVCNQNENRSKTAEEIFKRKYNTKSAGLYNKNPLSKKELSWADTVIVMEEDQGDEIAKRFPNEYMKKRVLSLNIPDDYHYNQPFLVKLLKEKIAHYGDLL